MKYGDKQTNSELIICGTPQGSVFGKFLFLVLADDLQKESKYLDRKMFADGTNL